MANQADRPQQENEPMIVPRLRQIQAVAGGDLMDMLIVVSIEDMPINEEDYCEEIEESP